MAVSNTFNIGLSYHNGSQNTVCIIVCHSQKPIDVVAVRAIAAMHLSIAMQTQNTWQKLVSDVMDGVRRDCGVETVLVPSDICCTITPHCM